MKIPLSACTYYGRLFLETYEAAGGLVPAEYIEPRLDQIIKSAAQAAAKPESRNCCCEFYATNYRFIEMILKFKCPVHGAVELDRKFAVNSVPAVTTTPYVPTFPTSIPHQPPINLLPNTGNPFLVKPNTTICGTSTRPELDVQSYYDGGSCC